MSELITIKSFETYIPARILQSRLEAEGIPCSLKDEQTVTMYWFWSNAVGGVKLQVFEKDKERAEQVIRELEDAAQEESATPGFWDDEALEQLDPANRICIHCGSKNTRKNDYQKKAAAWSILLLGFPLLFRSEKWHCFHCGEDS